MRARPPEIRRSRARRATGHTVAVAVALSGCVPAPMMPGGMGPNHMDDMMGSTSAETSDPSPSFGDARTIRVDAGDLWFEPAVVEVAAGERVDLVVANRGRIFHDLVIDDLDLRIDVDAGTTASGGLQVDVDGPYAFICSVPDHARGGREGTLVVR